MAIALFVLVLGVGTFILRIWLPVGSLLPVLNLPISLVPQYMALFIVGIIAYRRNWFLGIHNAMGKWWFCVALFFVVVVFPLVFLLGGALEGNTAPYMGGFFWQSLVYSVWEEFVGIGMILGLLIFFRQRFNHQGTLSKTLSASTYTVYFIHAPILVFLALALRGIYFHPLLKFALVSPIAWIFCFTIGFLLKKLPLVGKIL
jgi:hypothetical protein